MKKTWILVADSSRARIFEAESTIGELREIQALEHPESRLHEVDITADLPGRTQDITGQGRHSMEPGTHPKEHEATEFARQISGVLEKGRTDNLFGQLILVAAPSFLGKIRTELKPPLTKTIVHEVSKNLTQMDVEEIRNHLPELLPSQAV